MHQQEKQSGMSEEEILKNDLPTEVPKQAPVQSFSLEPKLEETVSPSKPEPHKFSVNKILNSLPSFSKESSSHPLLTGPSPQAAPVQSNPIQHAQVVKKVM